MQNGGLSCASDASMRGRSVSNAMVEYCVLLPVTGLLNRSVAFPKVSLATQASLKPVLSSLGMGVAFTQSADFAGLSKQACCIGLVEQFNMDRRLGRIRVPALVLAGARDLLVSERSLRDLCDGIARSTLVRLPECGHLAFVTHAERVAEEARRFLRP